MTDLEAIPYDAWIHEKDRYHVCSWDCDHDGILFQFRREATGEIFEHNDLALLHDWLTECFDRELFSMQAVQTVMLECLRQSAQDHDVGAEAVSPLHVVIHETPNEYGDTFWVRTQYRWSRKKEFGPIPEDDDAEWPFVWVDCPSTTSLADYGWSPDRGPSCYAD